MSQNEKQLKVYVAGSFNNADMCREAGGLIRDAGMHSYVFCDEGSEAFPHSMKIRALGLINTFTPSTALQNEHIKAIYKINMDELMTSDVVVLILPCGKSAHMEAGWIKGADGGKLIIYGQMKQGEFDAMYGMADLVTDDFQEVLWLLTHLSNEKGAKVQ